MNNIGFISKKKVEKEMARLYELHDTGHIYEGKYAKERFYEDCAAQSVLNNLCTNLKIKPSWLNRLGGGTKG